MIAYGTGCWSCRGFISHLNNCCSSLCYSLNKFIWCPLIVRYCTFCRKVNSRQRIIQNNSTLSIGYLSRWVISPNYKIANASLMNSNLLGKNRFCSVLIKSCKSRKILLWEARSIVLDDQAVGICWITYNYDLAVFISHLFYCLSSNFKNLSVLAQ